MHNIRFTFRIFLKDKFFSVLNVLGLALGIAISIILMMILESDLSYDKHYVNHERIYRLGSHYVIPDVDEYIGVTSRELGPILKETYPEIEQLVRIDQLDRTVVSYDSKTFFEENIAQADSSYFKIFNHKFISGDVNTCLDGQASAVITRTIALKYFNTEDALGKIFVVNKQPRTVTAVIEDLPSNTHLRFDILLSGFPERRAGWDFTMKNGKPIALVMWNPDVITYLLLPENYDVDNFYGRFSSIYKEYFIDEEVGGKGHANDPLLEPLAETHFSVTNGDGEYKALIAFTAVGALIVLLACINYMNLATAKAVKRATEITMKRLSGSGKFRLVTSLLFESVLMSMISLVVAIGIVYTVIEPLNLLTNKTLAPDVATFILSLVIALVIGILSGLYPAFYLTSIPVIKALKGSFKNGKSALLLRRSLIATQFAISIFVVICTLFMGNQLHFIRTKSLGFDRDNLLVVPTHESYYKQVNALRNEVLRLPNVTAAAFAGQVIGTGVGVEQMFAEGPNGMEQRAFLALCIGDDYLDMMGIKVVQGRSFEKGEDVESDGLYLATESAVKLMNWGDDAIGKQVSFWGDQNRGKIIGVVKDFNVNSLRIGIDPMFIIKQHYKPPYLHIKLTGDDIPGTIEAVKKIVAKFDSEHPFEYFFLDQKYDEQYKADVHRNQLLSILSYVCVFISLLGLLGLSAFSAVQRTKEIGIRKVLGANLAGILILLSKDILLLVVLATFIAMPLGWYVIDGWLEGFAYRAPLNYLLFVTITFTAMMFVVVVTVFQSWRTVNANPVESLKYE